jgi:hypothetical protein
MATDRNQLGGCHQQQRKDARPEKDNQDSQVKWRRFKGRAHVLVGSKDSRGATVTNDVLAKSKER